MKNPPNQYAIWDTEQERWFSNGRRTCWARAASAKNAWNGATGAGYRGNPVFSKQSRFVCYSVELQVTGDPL